MKNFLQSGDTVVIASAPEDVDSGEFIKLGMLSGVAVHAAASGAEVSLKRTGVFELPKATGAAWAQGAKLYWDVSEKKFTLDESKAPVNAIAFAAAGADDTLAEVLIDGDAIRLAAGIHTTASATDTVVTGLAHVIGAVAQFETDVADANMHAQAVVGDQAGSPAAGSIVVKTWKTSGSDPTPIAADAFSKKVSWIAFGR